MRRVGLMSLLLVLASIPADATAVRMKVIDFACFKNLSDGRVLVDGTQWDQKMKDLGYVLEDGAYVPWKVLKFAKQAVHDQIWADGMCRMQLLPVAR